MIKGHRPSADLIYGAEDSFSPSTVILLPERDILGYILFISSLMYPRSKPLNEAKFTALGHVLSNLSV